MSLLIRKFSMRLESFYTCLFPFLISRTFALSTAVKVRLALTLLFQTRRVTYLRVLLRRHDVLRADRLLLHGASPQRAQLSPLQEHRPPRSQARKFASRHDRKNCPVDRFRFSARNPAEVSRKLDRLKDRVEPRVLGPGGDFQRPRRDLHRHVVLRGPALRLLEVNSNIFVL